MASHAATHHAATRIDHTSILTAVLQAHSRLGTIDHAFVDQVTPQVFTVSATLPDGAQHPIQFFVAKVAIGSSGEWHRNMCNIRIGGAAWVLPTDLAVFAAFMRLTPLFQYPRDQIPRHFTTGNPPPVPGELIWFHAEWQIQYGLEEIRLPHKGFLSAAAWERDISHFVSAEGYAERATHLHALLVASEEPPEANEEPVNLLVEHAARREMAEMGHNPNSHDERDQHLLADLMMEWEQVIEVMQRRFAQPYPSPHHAVARN
uniref:FGENESH: predicted gene_12.24 protein n=1 Tax=Rhodotorula toruloides TaxID=5286 RepID=A0A0K3CM28_RHOTO